MSVPSVIDLLSRLALAGVFTSASVAKIARPGNTAETAISFGVPKYYAKWITTVLPLAEVIAAALLVPVKTARLGALLSLVLLIIFLVAIFYNLARGRTPPCNCFGQSNTKPIGRHTIVRNVALILVAAAIVWSSYESEPMSVLALVHAVSTTPAIWQLIELLLLSSVACVLFLLTQIIAQQGRILLRLSGLEESLAGKPTAVPPALHIHSRAGLPLGTQAPRFNAATLDGLPESRESLGRLGIPVVLLFTNPGCAPCNALLPEIAQWQDAYAATLSIWLISEGTYEENRGKHATNVLLQTKREIAEAYQAWGTPAAVMISPDGVIGSGLAEGADAIRRLISEVANTERAKLAIVPPRKAALAIGERAPITELLDFEGNTTSVTAYRGHKLVLLFWNPACGFCREMMGGMQELVSRHPPASSTLLILSAGNDEQLRRSHKNWSVFSDSDRKHANAFYAHGTPMAIEIDNEGEVSSELVAGKQQVLELIARQWDTPSAAACATHAGMALASK